MRKSFSTGLICHNPSPHVSSKMAYFPSVVFMDNGEILLSFVIGGAFEAWINLNAFIAHAFKDMSEVWSNPEPILIQQVTNLLLNLSCTTALPNDDVVANVARIHCENHPEDGLFDLENACFVSTDLLIGRSEDFGYSCKLLDPITPPLVDSSFELYSPIVPLNDGR